MGSRQALYDTFSLTDNLYFRESLKKRCVLCI